MADRNDLKLGRDMSISKSLKKCHNIVFSKSIMVDIEPVRLANSFAVLVNLGPGFRIIK